MAVSSLPEIIKRLHRRSSFEGAASELLHLLRSEAAAGLEQPSADVFKALTRCRTILKTRFTSPAFWQAGGQLCDTAQVTTRPCVRNLSKGHHISTGSNEAASSCRSSSNSTSHKASSYKISSLNVRRYSKSPRNTPHLLSTPSEHHFCLRVNFPRYMAHAYMGYGRVHAMCLAFCKACTKSWRNAWPLLFVWL